MPRSIACRGAFGRSSRVVKLGRKIASIESVDAASFRVRLRFRPGGVLEVDLGRLFARPKGLCAEILRGAFFGRCFLEDGALAWPNGFELCPDALFAWGAEQKKIRSRSRAA